MHDAAAEGCMTLAPSAGHMAAEITDYRGHLEPTFCSLLLHVKKTESSVLCLPPSIPLSS